MNKKIGFLGMGLLAMFVIGSFSFSAFAQDSLFSIIPMEDNIDYSEFVPEQLIVGLKTPDPNFHAKASLNGGQELASINQINAHLIKIPIKNEDNFIQAMSKNPNVQYVERNGIAKALDKPNDPFIDHQWGTKRIGMESVWTAPDFNHGSGITIAVIDEGLYYDHPDIAGINILTGIDKDYVDGDDDPYPSPNPCWLNGERENHGTWVTGVIAAEINNGMGIAGVGQFNILPLRVLNECGGGNLFDISDAIIYAAEQDVDVINLSLGHATFNHETLENAVNWASGDPDQIVVVAASGNDAQKGNPILYPAAFGKVVAVGATAPDDTITPYSSFGSHLDISAPGGISGGPCSATNSAATAIVTPGRASGGFTYYCVTGTSFAAPLVSAVAGLVKSANPCATDEAIKSHLEQTAEDVDANGWDPYYGYGIVNAPNALYTPFDPAFDCDSSDTSPVITLVGANPQIMEVNTSYSEFGATAFDNEDGDITADIVIDASAVDTSTTGIYPVSYNVADAAGNNAAEVTRNVNVEDTTPPVITLTGADPQIIEVGIAYTELGATASDNYDGDITADIFIDASAVDTSTLGDYDVTYDVDDSSGNSATQVTRTITVEDTTTVDPITVHVGDFSWQASDKRNWKAEVFITIHDGESPVSEEVVVDATFTDTEGGSFPVQCTTVAGICQVNKTTKLDQLTFTVTHLDSTLVSELTGHHDDDGDFNVAGIPTATILKGSSSGDSTPDPEPDPEPDPDPSPNCPPKSKKPVCNP